MYIINYYGMKLVNYFQISSRGFVDSVSFKGVSRGHSRGKGWVVFPTTVQGSYFSPKSRDCMGYSRGHSAGECRPQPQSKFHDWGLRNG